VELQTICVHLLDAVAGGAALRTAVGTSWHGHSFTGGGFGYTSRPHFDGFRFLAHRRAMVRLMNDPAFDPFGRSHMPR
jgi:hypothetical protein